MNASLKSQIQIWIKCKINYKKKNPIIYSKPYILIFVAGPYIIYNILITNDFNRSVERKWQTSHSSREKNPKFSVHEYNVSDMQTGPWWRRRRYRGGMCNDIYHHWSSHHSPPTQPRGIKRVARHRMSPYFMISSFSIWAPPTAQGVYSLMLLQMPSRRLQGVVT